MTRKFLAVMLLGVAVLVGCAPSVESGVVVDKRYHPSYQTWSNTCYSYNDKGQCTLNIPTATNHPEKFQLTIEGYAEGEAELRQSTYNVRESVYDSVEIGDTWSKEE